MFFSFTRFFRGYLRVSISGYAPERFLNLCGYYDMLIWDLQHTAKGYEFYISLPAFFSLKPLLKKTKTTIHILKRCGFPFFLQRYRKRKMFFVGLVLCCGLLYVSSGYLWRITIAGNTIHSDETLRRYLSHIGIECGIRQKKLNCSRLEEQLRLKYPDITWVSARLQGTHLYLELKENQTSNKKQTDKKSENMEQGYDLIATHSGKIAKIVTRSGTPEVHIGDKVKKGTVLISGALPIWNDSGEIERYHYTKADGDVYIERVIQYKNKVSFLQQEKIYEGEPRNRYSCKIWNRTFSIPFWKKEIGQTENFSQTKQLHLLHDFYLPVWLEKKTIRNYHVKQVRYDENKAKSLAKYKYETFLKKLEKKNVEILQKNVMIDSESDTCCCHGQIRIMEKAGIYHETSEKKQDERQISDEFNRNDT